MNKGMKIFLGIVLVLVVIGFVMFNSLTSSETIQAQLFPEAGSVLLNSLAVSEDTNLEQGDVIETSSDGMATVILYESIVINLEPNTKITLDDLTNQHPQVTQEGGETWNQFTKLFGVEEYTIKAGNSVASVRGTGFGLTEEKIIVGEGEVDYELDGQKFRVIRDKVVEKIEDKIEERDFNEEERQKVIDRVERTINNLKKLREEEIQKHPRAVELIKKQFELTDEDIRKGLEDADEGKVSIGELKEKSPIQIESVEKVEKITREIRKLREQKN